MKDKNTEHGKKFSFNENVSSCFSDMLSRSIPTYDLMRDLTTRLVKNCFTESINHVLDIGTSTGEVIYKLCKDHPEVTFTGLESSDAMIKQAEKRFSQYTNVSIEKHDIREPIIFNEPIDIVVSSLTIQFTPIEYRLKIIQNIYDILKDKGTFIFIEKVLGSSAHIDSSLIDVYYDMKRENGYSEDEIQRKRMALEGVLVPVTAKWNEELLKMSGFKQIDCFWRCLNFCGWIAIK